MATTDAPIVGAALTSPTSVSQFRSDFDAFLYASVEERSDGPMLSVLSALARMDIDPWQEAAKLARMSRDKAIWRMAALIETLPANPSAHVNSKAIATRLIALLPRQIVISVGTTGTSSVPGKSAKIRAVMVLIILNAIFVVILFGNQYLTRSRPSVTPSKHVYSSVINKLNPDAPALNVDK